MKMTEKEEGKGEDLKGEPPDKVAMRIRNL